MNLHMLNVGESMPAARDDIVVCIPLYNAHDYFVRCLSSVMEHTAADVSILVADDASPDTGSLAWVEQLDRDGQLTHEIWWHRRPQNGGFVTNTNGAIVACAPADVVLLNSDCVVAEGWLESLRDAAHSDSTVATVTTLTNHGSIVSVPHRNRPHGALPQDLTIDDAARRVREGSARLYPRLPTAIGHCILLRRSAIELVGIFDEAFSPGYGEEVDFSQRCLHVGLQHIVADDVLVFHQGGASLASAGKIERDRMIDARYPYYEHAVEEAKHSVTSPLARSLIAARQALIGRSATIDGRCLGGVITGTQVHTIELIAALVATKQIRIRVLVPDELGAYAAHTLADLDVTLIRQAEVREGLHRDDVVHRPFQISLHHDLELLLMLGERLIVTQQDLIAFRNPSYFPGREDWSHFRRLTRDALALADLVLFFSAHAQTDALQEDLVSPERSAVVHIGVDHATRPHLPPTPPAGGETLLERPFLICLGTDFRHKNRVFALRLLHELRTVHGWDGTLVLAGPHVEPGSSASEEAQWSLTHRETARAVQTFGAVDEATKDWLIENAAAVLYPTVYEGFGLVPFEAAAAGTPCLFAHQTSLAEVLPDATGVLVPWDPAASAAAVIEVLRDPVRQQQLVDEVLAASANVTWAHTADLILKAYDRAILLPATEASTLAAAEITIHAGYWQLRHEVGEAGLALVGPGNALLPEETQRSLVAIVKRPAARSAMVGALRVARDLSRRASGGRPSRNSATADEPNESSDQ